jgi:hypothetical protein
LNGIRLRSFLVNRTIAIMRVRTLPLSPIAERFIAALREVAKGLR